MGHAHLATSSTVLLLLSGALLACAGDPASGTPAEDQAGEGTVGFVNGGSATTSCRDDGDCRVGERCEKRTGGEFQTGRCVAARTDTGAVQAPGDEKPQTPAAPPVPPVPPVPPAPSTPSTPPLPTTPPAPPLPPPTFEPSLVAGHYHTCAAKADGTVRCWGQNGGGGLLGTGIGERLVPALVGGLGGVSQLSAGYGDTCSRTWLGELQCWGQNTFGQLGVASAAAAPQTTTPAKVVGVTAASAIHSGWQHTCAITAGGAAKCWGLNENGQLGDGTTSTRSGPVDVVGLTQARLISGGWYHSCAVLADGSLKCWGHNPYQPSVSSPLVATTVAGITNAKSVTTGVVHTCVLSATGQVRCWGGAAFVGGGDGTAPRPVAGLSDVISLAAGWAHTCAVHATGKVSCWGYGTFGALGADLPGGATTPVHVQGLDDATHVTAGYGHTCARTRSRRVMCWGYNGFGQLGNGGKVDSAAPVEVSGLTL